MSRPRKNWIALASAEHVALGRAGGFMQVCHGKAGPLRRLSPGDRIVYYSSLEVYRSRQMCRAFTAIGEILPGPPYQFEMGPGFLPFRRNVAWWHSQRLPVQQILEQLEFSRGKSNWAAPLRFGLCQISAADMDLLAAAMLLEPAPAISEQQLAALLNSTKSRQICLPW